MATHHNRVDVIGLVIARPAPQLDKTFRYIQCVRHIIVCPHLQENLPRSAVKPGVKQGAKQRSTKPQATSGLGDRDGLNVPLVRTLHHTHATEAEQIVAALRARNQRVEYLRFDNEGHGLARRENRVRAYGAMVQFFDSVLGGTPTP